MRIDAEFLSIKQRHWEHTVRRVWSELRDWTPKIPHSPCIPCNCRSEVDPPVPAKDGSRKGANCKAGSENAETARCHNFAVAPRDGRWMAGMTM